MGDTRTQISNGKTWLMVLQFILPVILGIVAVYGSVKYTSGETQQRLLQLETRMKANEETIDKISDRAVTREELRQFIDTTRSDLGDIKTDIRAMRSSQK